MRPAHEAALARLSHQVAPCAVKQWAWSRAAVFPAQGVVSVSACGRLVWREEGINFNCQHSSVSRHSEILYIFDRILACFSGCWLFGE